VVQEVVHNLVQQVGQEVVHNLLQQVVQEDMQNVVLRQKVAGHNHGLNVTKRRKRNVNSIHDHGTNHGKVSLIVN
jgi:hypothetical protein